ncbi:MAG: response regulator [Dehalococcoidales bacterium]|nr:response regulator [Dehalococcoidales bacterium]
MTRIANKKKKILLVEDELVIGRLFRRVLIEEGFSVDFVQDGLIASEVADSKNYDLLISDIRLPGITGIELYEKLKLSKPELSLHTIFITGDTMNVDIQLFIRESGMPCLVKPFAPEELVKAVKKSLK